MKCDRCEHVAAVHEVVKINGKTRERHLCESCARDAGIIIEGGPSAETLEQLIHVLHASPSLPAAVYSADPNNLAIKDLTCPSCGMKFSQFLSTEKLGCPTCYSAFGPQLSGRIAREHNASTHHLGKVPKRMLMASRLNASVASEPGVTRKDVLAKLAVLRSRIESAVAAEHYERASALRKELLRLGDVLNHLSTD
jgi:protein arginine kinase activator